MSEDAIEFVCCFYGIEREAAIANYADEIIAFQGLLSADETPNHTEGN